MRDSVKNIAGKENYGEITLKKIGFHGAIWFLVMIFFYVGEIRLSHSFAIWDSLMVVFGQMVIFYSNIYWKYKSSVRLHYRIKSISLLIVLTSVSILTEHLTEIRQLYGIKGGDDDWYTLFSVSIFVAFNLSALFASELYIYQREMQKHLMEIQQLREEQTSSQLELLKAKINPHFLFNSLNAIYTMSYLKDERTPEKIMQLSELLRYVLYDCDDNVVPLQKELDYLKTYIDLNQLRGKYSQHVSFHIEGDSNRYLIAPMLLLPFVENAYKHSHILREKEGYININIKINEGLLLLFVENSIPENKRENIVFGSHGIGSENVRKRLDLQYKNRYSLEITEATDKYKIELKLNLNEHDR